MVVGVNRVILILILMLVITKQFGAQISHFKGGDRGLGGDFEDLDTYEEQLVEDVDFEELVEDIDDRKDLNEYDGFFNDFYGDRRRIERGTRSQVWLVCKEKIYFPIFPVFRNHWMEN